MYDWTVASPSAGIRMRPHLCATQTAAFTCRLQTNPLMGLHHSTHFSDRQTHGDAATLQTTRRIEPFPSAAIQFMIKCESDISCQKHLKPQNNTFLLIFFQICGRKRNASPKPYYLPIPWVTFSLSVPTPPPPTFYPSSYSTIKYSSRWFGFNNSRSWWGHSWRANTGTVSSICLWMGNNDPIPPDTSSWQRMGGGPKVTKRNRGKADLWLRQYGYGCGHQRIRINKI